jgi:hypothetical protein
MKTNWHLNFAVVPWSLHTMAVALAATISLVLLPAGGRGDTVELVNGDRYSGTVISVNLTNVTLQSEVQGEVRLSRAKVARIIFRDIAATHLILPSQPAPAISAAPGATKPGDPARQLRGQGADTNTIAELRKQVLTGAGPEAARQFNEMVWGLMGGSLKVGDLRKQAQQTIDQVEASREELGPEVGEVLDGYLKILRGFTQEVEAEEAASAQAAKKR